jgi:hypothetical protein
LRVAGRLLQGGAKQLQGFREVSGLQRSRDVPSIGGRTLCYRKRKAAYKGEHDASGLK